MERIKKWYHKNINSKCPWWCPFKLFRKKNKTVSEICIERDCCACGKPFKILLDKNGKILTEGVFYGGKIRRGIGMWSAYEWIGWDKEKQEPILKKCNPWYRELWYRLIDFKRLIFHQYEDIEYWECEKCLRRGK